MVIQNTIGMELDKKAGIIIASATTQDPLVTATVADSMVNKLQAYIYTYRTEKAKRDLSFTENLFSEAQQKYFEAQRRYAEAIDANRNLAKLSARVELDRLQNEFQLAFGVYSQLAQQLEKAKIKVQEQTSTITIIEPTSVPVKSSNMSKIMLMLGFAFLAGIYGVGRIFVRELFYQKKEVADYGK